MLNAVPPTAQAVDSNGILTSIWQAFLSSVGYYLRPVGQSGPTANRPTNTSQTPLYVSQPYFDTDLGKPIWVKTTNPPVWVDATGTTV